MSSPGWTYRKTPSWSNHIRPWLATRKLLVAGVTTFSVLVLLTYNSGAASFGRSALLEHPTCTPEAYASGRWSWHPRTNITTMTNKEQAHAFSGFEGCASSREYDWHLATDTEAVWKDRFPKAQSWEWIPGRECSSLRHLDPASLLKDLVEDGAWYLVGDSVTEGHFFSLSCILYPHVRAMPYYAPNTYFDRGVPQYLYLNPNSPLLSSIKIPKGFDIASTPLVLFRRIDVLFSKEELIDIHRTMQNTTLEDDTLFSDEGVWTMSPSDYLKEFLEPLPKGNFATMVVSTAGHWTETTFSKVNPEGINGVLQLFEVAMRHWAGKVQTALWEANGHASAKWKQPKKNKRVVVRAYLPGHEDCFHIFDPLDDPQVFKVNYYNWGQIPTFNDIFKKLLSNTIAYPDIHFLGIDRPGRMRPDAHATGDCLHIMTGAGVMEEWTRYIWQYITREIQ